MHKGVGVWGSVCVCVCDVPVVAAVGGEGTAAGGAGEQTSGPFPTSVGLSGEVEGSRRASEKVTSPDSPGPTPARFRGIQQGTRPQSADAHAPALSRRPGVNLYR